MEGRWERWAPVSGLVFAVAWVLLASGLQLSQVRGTSWARMRGEPL